MNNIKMNTGMAESRCQGYLELILGPMFSGKTTRLVQHYKKYSYIGKTVAVINYADDTRYHDSLLSTHDKIMIPCVFARTIASVKSTIGTADIVLINEGQFFEDIYETVIEMVETHKKIVYICGLDGDFKRNRFGRLLDLLPYCDEITKLSSLCAYCKNGTRGIFSHRITNETSQVVIGTDNYVPLCRKCYKEHNLF
jgi:thymidine kinase